MNIFKRKRRFYVKQNGLYLTTEMHTSPKWYTPEKSEASTYTDAKYDAIKRSLPENHTLELVK